MITPKEYFTVIKTVNVNSFPEKLKKGYEFTEEVTEYHNTWKYYKSDKDIKRAVDSYLKELSAFLEKSPPRKLNAEDEAREAAKKLIGAYVRRGDTVQQIKAGQMGTHGGEFSAMIKGNKILVDEVKGKKVNYSFPLQSIYNEIQEETGGDKIKPPQPHKTSKSMKQSKPIKKEPVKKEIQAKEVERVDDEVRLIKRYALMNGKKKTDGQILNFLNAVQKAILEKRIRKSSPYAKEIEYIQTNLAKLYNRMENKVEIKIDKGVLEKFSSIAVSEKVRPSVTYLKRYIGMQGKKLTKEKVQRLITLMQNAARKHKITKDDPYVERLQKAFGSLAAFVKSAKKNDMLEIHPAVLNGINEALEGCGCCEEEHLDGVDEEGFTVPEPKSVQAPRIMNSLDFAEMQFDTLGFTGKWLDLIGDPCEGFTAMVFGKPKMGKSYLCVEMAGYLARHHGDTLYVAKEEKLDKTLQDKLCDKNVKHPCLFVSDHLPDDLSPYQFIILDSVNRLGLNPQDLDHLKVQNPGKSFIHIFQTTKEGNFRGANQFQHDVDVVIEVPEKGKAVQFGRFNQGGEIEIFQSEKQAQNDAPVLLGTKMKYDILSPDGFTIRIGVEPFDSMKKAREYFKKWKDRFKIQGYYSSVPYGRIPLVNLEDYCQFVEWDPKRFV